MVFSIRVKEHPLTKKRRDNFTAETIKALERRVNAKCSRCRAATSGPNLDPTKASNLGIAAHINAASPGGPRYDKNMDKAARKAIENGIWLCSNCATIIDRDPGGYSPSLLSQMKEKAEQLASEEYGNFPVSRREYDALYGLTVGSLKKTVLSTAVTDICRLSAAALEELDPRFSVDVSHSAGRTSYIFNAKEPISITCSVQPGFEQEFLRKLGDLVAHGKNLEIDSSNLRFQGSPLLEFATELHGKIVWAAATRKDAIIKIRTGSNTFVDDIVGEIIGGSKSITVSGHAFGGLYALRITCDRDLQGTCHSSSKFHFDRWEGKSIRALPYFDKAFQLYTEFFEERSMDLTIEAEGRAVLSGKGVLLGNKDKCVEVYRLLRHIRNVKFILSALNLDVRFNSEIEISNGDVEGAEITYQYLNAYKGLIGSEIATFKIYLDITPASSEEGLAQFVRGAAGVIKMERPYNGLINLMGLLVENVVVNITFTHAALRNLLPHQMLNAGECVELEIHPAEDCVVHTTIGYRESAELK